MHFTPKTEALMELFEAHVQQEERKYVRADDRTGDPEELQKLSPFAHAVAANLWDCGYFHQFVIWPADHGPFHYLIGIDLRVLFNVDALGKLYHFLVAEDIEIKILSSPGGQDGLLIFKKAVN